MYLTVSKTCIFDVYCSYFMQQIMYYSLFFRLLHFWAF